MFVKGDALRLPFQNQTFDLVFGSPPYCDARTYGINAQRNCREWIDWMLEATAEAVRVCKGLVLWVCAGVTRKHCYWPACEGLLYRWWEQGGHCWRPAFWHRIGIPGSGGRQWLRADVEYVLAFKRPGVLPWADNTACGHKPKWAPGGRRPSHRLGRGMANGIPGSTKGSVMGRRVCRGHDVNGDTLTEDAYLPPAIANPGNLVKVIVGGGVMGDKECHENEAPFPERLAEFFIRSWCPEGGLVLDPFAGSGTVVAVARKLQRRGVGLDIRDSQCSLGLRRMSKGLDVEMFV